MKVLFSSGHSAVSRCMYSCYVGTVTSAYCLVRHSRKALESSTLTQCTCPSISVMEGHVTIVKGPPGRSRTASVLSSPFARELEANHEDW